MSFNTKMADLMSVMMEEMNKRERADAIMRSKMELFKAALVGDITGREAEVEQARQEVLDSTGALLDVIVSAHKRVEALKPND